MGRAIIAMLLLVGGVVPGSAGASEQVPDGNGGMVDVYPMVFPVDGPNRYTDTWGACRGTNCERRHLGVDILADKMVPVLAVADGVVTHVNWGRVGQEHCCSLAIVHDDGWQTRYIHLNNDTPGTDDGLGWGVAPGIERGVRVRAGQHIGWVGDSGNAENTAPHLHLELMRPDGTWINPHPHVLRARPAGTGRFVDTAATVHRANIERIAELGITRGCNPPVNDRYCPERLLTRGEVAAMLRRTLALPASATDFFTDDGASIFQNDINALTAAGIGFGCSQTEFCPDRPLLRSEMARFLVRAFGYPPSSVNAFVDDDGSPFEADIDALAAARVTRGCNPPANDRYCPDRTLTRAEFATFVVRALDGPDR